ncbi:MAG: hypothetical protein AAFP97_10845, partial [Pseudomonadota bacterium]
IPGWFPRTAKNITEVHNLDTNELTIHAFIDRQDIKRLLAKCLRVEAVSEPRYQKRPFRQLINGADKLSCDNPRTGRLDGLLTERGELMLWTATTP